MWAFQTPSGHSQTHIEGILSILDVPGHHVGIPTFSLGYPKTCHGFPVAIGHPKPPLSIQTPTLVSQLLLWHPTFSMASNFSLDIPDLPWVSQSYYMGIPNLHWGIPNSHPGYPNCYCGHPKLLPWMSQDLLWVSQRYYTPVVGIPIPPVWDGQAGSFQPRKSPLQEYLWDFLEVPNKDP
ncbi:hypothetical protein BU15DRAFT_58850 [Melanogaster broomeanus]|nr:hypothetical protein BU15DRAFT_58850 [Melanogaster broomeanus]